MTNELVKEIEGSIKRLEYVRQRHYNTIGGAETVIACERAELALQRARDALRWIPVEEWRQGSRESDIYEVTIAEDGKDGDVYQRHLLYWNNTEKIFSDFDGEQEITSLEVIAVKPASLPYTPEDS